MSSAINHIFHKVWRRRLIPSGLKPGRLLALWFAVVLLPIWVPVNALAGVIAGLEIPGLTAPYTAGVSQYSFVDSGACSVPVKVTLTDPTLNLYVQSAKVASGATRNAWVCDSHQTISVVVYRGWSEQARLTIAKVQQAPPPPPAPDPEPEPQPEPEPEPPAETPPPPSASGALSSLVVAGLSPSFSPDITSYAIPDTGNCSVPVTATLSNPQHRLYVQSTATTSGQTVNAWMCDGHPTLSIVVYQNWTEMGRYTVYKGSVPDTGGTPVPDPEPEPDPDEGGDPPDDSQPPADSGDDDGASGDPDPGTDTGSGGDYTPTPTAFAAPARFLNYAAFGPSPSTLAEVANLGIQGWLDQQFALSPSQISPDLNVNQLRSEIFLNMANGQDQLRQRMIFALGQILVVSSNKNVNGYEMEPWIRLLSDNAFGNYRTLLRKVSVSPSMGKYLDHANSRKATLTTAPNENYPRELMQLFSIGLWQLNQDGTRKLDEQDQPIPTYSQDELRAVARALTGWTYPTAAGATPRSANGEHFVGDMEPRPDNHDSGAKTLPGGYLIPAGQSPDDDLDDVVDFLFNHPNIAPFMATRLIRSLVTSNPSLGYITRVADTFDDNGSGVRGDLKAVLRAVLTDPEALDPANTARARLKDPLLYFVGLGRALSASMANPSQYHYLFANQSEMLLSPPSVFGFYSPLAPLPNHPELFGPEFQIYPPSLAIQRANMVYQILTGQFGSAFYVDTAPYIALGGDTDALLDKINNDLLQGTMSVELRGIISAACDAAYDNNQRAIGALYLALLSGEYQVQR